MSSLPIFYQKNQFSKGTQFVPDEDVTRHMMQVLRMQSGEQVEFANGEGLSAIATILEAGKKRCTVSIDDVREIIRPIPALHLAIAFTKNASRNEWLLEKATELGVQRIIPLVTTRTERERFRFDRLNSILISAMMQSQQYWLPILAEPTVFAKADMKQTQVLLAHCMDEMPRQPIKEALQPGKDTLILIGPEGDFTKEEVILAMEHGAKGINLGTTRLRTETAAMAACAYFHLLNDNK